MTIIDNIEAHEHSATAAACEHAALYGATPERDEFDTRDVWDADDAHRRGDESASSHRASVGTSRRTREPALGLRQHARRPDPAPRPRRRQADARPPRPPARAGRHRDQVPRAGACDGPGEPRQPARRVRDHARRGREPTARPAACGPGADRTPAQTGKLGGHRRPRLPVARPWLPQGTLVAITGGKDIAEAAVIERRQGPRQIRRHDPRSRRRPRRREDRGKLGRAQRRPPDRLQAGLGPPRSGRTVPPQRRPPEPAAEGRHRLPRQRHHREPRRPRGSSAFRSGPRPEPRAASLRWRGPFLFRFNRRACFAIVAASPRPPSVSLRSPPAQPFSLHVMRSQKCRQPRAIRNRYPLPRTAGRTTP